MRIIQNRIRELFGGTKDQLTLFLFERIRGISFFHHLLHPLNISLYGSSTMVANANHGNSVMNSEPSIQSKQVFVNRFLGNQMIILSNQGFIGKNL